MRERHQLFYGLRLAGKKFHHSATRTKIEQHFGIFFHQSAPANRTAFYANREPNKQEIGLMAQNFEVVSNIQY
jgi:hypothetical protein